MMNIEKHKWCWVAKEYKKGWKLGLDLSGTKAISWIRGIYFASKADVGKALGTKGKIVFVQMATK